jgi:ATP-dependent DNA helicase PIF1
MRVVLQANIDPNSGLVNGSQGTVVGFEPFDEKKLPKKADSRSEVDDPKRANTRGTHASRTSASHGLSSGSTTA